VIFNFLVGNNDAHGKNFSLLYHGAGTAGLETRLAPLYDVVSTRYYSELTREMAMKIGGEYSSDRVSKTNFEQLAEGAGLAKPLVRRRVPELAEAVLLNLDQTGIEHPVAEALAGQIRAKWHCSMTAGRGKLGSIEAWRLAQVTVDGTGRQGDTGAEQKWH